MDLQHNTRGQSRQMTVKLVGLVIALTIGAILIGSVMPIGINAVENDTNSLTQTTGVTNTNTLVDGKLNATVDSITVSTTDSATITITDLSQDPDQSISQSIDNQTSATYSFSSGDVTVELTDVDDSTTPSTATYTVSYQSDFGWNDSTKSLWGLIPVFLILGALVLLAGIVLRQM